jgi:hypothetical protein
MPERLQLSELICQIDRQFAANSGHTCLKTIASGMTGLKAEQT